MVLTEAATIGTPPGRPKRADRRRMRRALLASGAAVVLLGAGLGTWRVAAGGAPAPLPASAGLTEDRPTPTAVLDAPLVDTGGLTTTLSAYRGRVVVVVPFLTSCQEVCPLTTAALLQVQRSVVAAGMRGRVAIIEVSLDPDRDTPSRLAAYARLTGATWPLLTGSPSTLAAFWKSLGIYVARVPEGSPPGIDWQTGHPYTYDVDHADGFFLLGPDQHTRFLTLGAPDVRRTPVSAALREMLDTQGRQNLAHPGGSAWTVDQMLQGIGWLTGRAVPTAPLRP